MGFDSVGMSHLSTQYLLVPVAAKNADGTSRNPTADPVAFAFMATPTAVPGSGDWVTGSWQTNSTSLLYPYVAQCLVGPSGTTNPGIGNFIVYLRVTDSPEVPVLAVGQLQIS